MSEFEAQVHPASYTVDVAVLPKSGMQIKFNADEDICAAIAEFYSLAEVQKYELTGKILRWRKDGAKFEGKLVAELDAHCVVTEGRVPQAIEEDLMLYFAPEHSKMFKPRPETEAELVLDVSDEDPPEPFSGNMIDLGAVAAEYFSLALTPFPRVEGAEITDEAEAAGDEKPSPFAVLAELNTPKSE